MRVRIIPFMLAAALLLQGCFVLSLHPLYTDSDVVFDEQLVGRWQESPDSAGAWVFEATDDEDAYLLKLVEGDSLAGAYEAHLVKLGEYLFLDLFPAEPDNLNEYFASHAVLAHSFWRVDLKADTLKLSSMDFDWLKQGIEDGQIKIKHEPLEHCWLLTAQPRDLQNLVLKYPTEAFEDYEVAYRVR